jgi:tripartite-type tricarboxylate transporter receptor subunit TctC
MIPMVCQMQTRRLARRLAGFVAVLLAALAHGPAPAAESWPSRVVTIVAPSAPGGLYSLFARVLADRLAPRLGATFIVENRPGAASVVGAGLVAHAAADGYTLMVASGATLAVNVTLHRQLPYDAQRDFVPIALIARVPEVLVVDPALPVRTIADLKTLARTHPLTFASAGAGTMQHLEGEMLKRTLGLDMTHVPYKGALPAITDVAGGHVTMMFSPIPNALGLIQAGKVRAIGLAARKPVAALPGVASLAEVGAPGFETGAWFMLVAPAATPTPIVARLHDETRAILAEPKLRAQFVAQGLVPVETPTVDELKVFVREQIAYWDRTLHQIGLAGME